MRNLKRALSLALASVMLLGMMVVGTSASYPDVKADDNKEAIEVMQLLGVMEGDDKGNFNPAKAVTRNEMAVIMCKLLDLNTKDYAGSCPFTDVPAWAEPYVAACYANKIVSGTSATTYGGDQTVTTAQAALMILKALGYFQFASDFGDDWMVATVKQASKIELFDGIDVSANAALTRNDVAQMALNALEADVVEPDGNGGTTIKGDGFEITTGSVKYNTVETTKYDYTKADGEYADGTSEKSLQLVEKLFGSDVRKTTSEPDKLGRPATKWESEDADDSVLTAKKAAKTFVISKSTNLTTLIKDNDIKLTDGANTNSIDALVVGDVVEMFKDSSSGKINLVIKYTYGFDQIKKISKAAKDAKYDYLVKIGNSTYKDTDIDGFSTAWEKDDYVVFIEAQNTLVYCAKAESVSGKMTAKGSAYVKVDGTKYTAYAGALTNLGTDYTNEYDFYLDPNGFVAGVEKITDKATSKDYLYLSQVEIKNAGTGLKDKDDAYGMAKVTFMDGTEKTIDLYVKQATKDLSGDDYAATISKDSWYYVDPTNDKYTALSGSAGAADTTAQGKLAAGFYSYTMKDGMYVLSSNMNVEDKTVVVADTTNDKQIELVKKQATATYDVGGPSVTKTVNSKTVLTLIDDTVKTYTGIANFSTATYKVGTDNVKGILIELDKDSKVINHIYVVGGTSVNDSNWAYIASKGDTTEDGTLWTVYVDGEAKSYYGDNSTAKGLYDITVNDDDEITEDVATNVKYGTVASIDDSFITIKASGSDTVVYLDDTAVYNVSGDYKGEKFDLSKGDVVAMGTKTVDGKLTAEVIYIIDAPELETVVYETVAADDEDLEFVQNGNEIILTGTKKDVKINFTDKSANAQTITIAADATEIVYYTDASEDGTIGDGIAITINVESMIAAD